MRKSVLSTDVNSGIPSKEQLFLNLEEIARVEVSSEDPSYPIENAFRNASDAEWRASVPGPQTIRLVFDEPRSIHRIHLEFQEDGMERSQEFAIYAATSDQNRREILRQQWTFSPGGSNREIEDYSVELSGVEVIELQIDPGRHDKQRIATLRSFSIA